MEELEDKDAEGNRQKFFKEVEALGEEQILELDKKLSRFDEIEKQIAMLTVTENDGEEDKQIE